MIPVFIAATFFTALLIVDFTSGNTRHIGFHFTGGLLALLGIYTLCSFFGPVAGWIFLAIPFLVILLGGLHAWTRTRKDALVPRGTSEQENACPPPPCTRAAVPSAVAALPRVPPQNRLDSCTPVPKPKPTCVSQV